MKNVARCQFNLDRMTSACLSLSERKRDRDVERGRTIELLILLVSSTICLSFICLLSVCISIYFIPLSVSCGSKLSLWKSDIVEICGRHFYIFLAGNILLLPASSIPVHYVQTPLLLHFICPFCVLFPTLSIPQAPCKVLPKDSLLPASPV